MLKQGALKEEVGVGGVVEHQVMARIETTRRPAALTAPPLVAPVPTSPVAEGTPTNLGMSAVLPTAPQTEVTLDWDTAQAAGEYRDAMEGFLQALTAVQANGVAPQVRAASLCSGFQNGCTMGCAATLFPAPSSLFAKRRVDAGR
jgi:hypothetical protein